MNQSEILKKLAEFDTETLSDSPDSVFLSFCLHSDDFQVKSKAFFVLERWGDIAAVLALCETFRQEQRLWQLRLLNVIALNRITAAMPLLEQCLLQRECPLLIRGAFAATAAVGGAEAAELVVKFLKSPFCGYLKTEFMADTLADMMARDSESAKTLLRYCKTDPDFYRLMELFRQKGSGNELLMVYPYPDYLSRCAEEAGITPKEWKSLTYFPRRKKQRSNGK